MTLADDMTPRLLTEAGPRCGAIAVSEGYCINLRGRIELCDLCRRACHAGAIAVGADGVTVDPDRCTECGACVPACPAGAFVHAGFDPEDLIRHAGLNGHCRIACAATKDDAQARIPCHKMLDARLAAALFAEGADVIEPVGTEQCGNCPGGDARSALASTARTMDKWFGDAAPQLRIAADSRSADGDRAVRRRALLRRALRSLAPLPAPPPSFDEYAELDDPEEAAPPRPVPYQAVLASRRHRLPFRPGGPVGATGRMIGAACSGCLVCAELCPTGALEGDCSARHRAISFDPARCTNCTLCLKICPMGAVGAKALRGVAAACAGRILLYGRAEQHCTGCGRQFAATEGNSGLCAACETEMELDAEWLDLLKN